MGGATNSDMTLASLSMGTYTDVTGNLDNPSSFVIRPKTFYTTSSDYQPSYAFKLMGMTTDQIDSRINLATPVLKWVGSCDEGGTSFTGITLAQCNTACHASSTCYVIVYKESISKCWF